MRIVLAGAAAIAILLPFASHAQMYKCVDERGRIQFRDVPCKGMVKPKPAAPAANKPKPKPKPSGKAQAQQEKLEADRAAVSAQRRRCAALRSERLALASESGPRVFNAAGERVFTDKKRSERYAALNSELRGCP